MTSILSLKISITNILKILFLVISITFLFNLIEYKNISHLLLAKEVKNESIKKESGKKVDNKESNAADKKQEKESNVADKKQEKESNAADKKQEKINKEEEKVQQKIDKEQKKIKRSSKKAEKKLAKEQKKLEKNKERKLRKNEKFTSWFDIENDKNINEYEKGIKKAQLRYQEEIEKIIKKGGTNQTLKLIKAEDKLKNRLAKENEKFSDDILQVSKKISKNETLSLVNSGWVNDSVFAKGFENHGQRVKTYVEIAKLLGVSTYIGALQANFGNIYETGIYDIQNNINDLENLTIKNKEIFDLNIDEVGRLSNEINELNFELLNYTNEIEDQNILLNDQNRISEILLNQIEEINNSLIVINEEVNELSTSLLNESLSDEEISSLQFQLDNLELNKLTLENSIDTSVENLNLINSDILSIQSDIEELNIFKFDLETDISNSNNLIDSLNQKNEQLSIENIDLENQILKFQQELELVIENVKPGVGSDSEWQVVNLDTNNDGVINEFDLEIN